MTTNDILGCTEVKWVFLLVLKSVHARKYDASTQSFIVFIIKFHLHYMTSSENSPQ